MQYYMCLFGSAINFFGGPGECNHKKFVKATGNNTQKRVDSFASQVAQRLYENMLLELAKEATEKKDSAKFDLVEKRKEVVGFSPQGRYIMSVEGLSGDADDITYSCTWAKQDKSKSKCLVPEQFIPTIARYLRQNGFSDNSIEATGFTSCSLMLNGRKEIFRASSSFHNDGHWYDWCLMEYLDEDQSTSV
ncbi:hypothetical protein ACHAXR_000481, partial [Thalassiosira sp. AJA248-18]